MANNTLKPNKDKSEESKDKKSEKEVPIFESDPDYYIK